MKLLKTKWNILIFVNYSRGKQHEDATSVGTWKYLKERHKKQSAAFEKLTLKYFNSTSKNQKQSLLWQKYLF